MRTASWNPTRSPWLAGVSPVDGSVFGFSFFPGVGPFLEGLEGRPRGKPRILDVYIYIYLSGTPFDHGTYGFKVGMVGTPNSCCWCSNPHLNDAHQKAPDALWCSLVLANKQKSQTMFRRRSLKPVLEARFAAWFCSIAPKSESQCYEHSSAFAQSTAKWELRATQKQVAEPNSSANNGGIRGTPDLFATWL